MSYYIEIGKVIETAVANDDMEILSLILNSVVPAMTSEDRDRLLENKAEYLVLASERIQEMLLDSLHWDENDAAKAFLSMHTELRRLSEKIMARLAPLLGGAYDRVVSHSISIADVEALEIIARENDYRPLSSAVRNSMPRRHGFSYLSSPRDTRKLFDLCNKMNAHPVMERHLTLTLEDGEPAVEAALPEHIPVFENGVLNQPELAIAFAEQSRSTSHMYDFIPCWVAKEDVDILQSARLYSWKNAFMKTDKRMCSQEQEIPETEWLQCGSNIENDFFYHVRGFAPDASAENADQVMADDFLLSIMLDRSAKLGLRVNPDKYRLAIVDVREAMSLEVGSLSSQRIESARQYAEGFFSGQYVMARMGFYAELDDLRKKTDLGLNIFIERGHSYVPVGETLISYLKDDPEVFSRMVDLYPVDYWSVEFPVVIRVEPFQMVELQKKCGFDEKRMYHRSYSVHDLATLRKLGFKLQCGSHTAKEICSRFQSAQFECYVHILRMGGDLEKPIKLEDVIKSSSRRKLSDAEEAVLLCAEPCEVIKLCKTEKQASAVIAIAERRALPEWEETRSEWVKLVPKALRRSVVERDLGL